MFGSAAMDVTSHASVPLSLRSTTPGSITFTPGGVGRNVAEAAQNLLDEHAVMLVSAVGSDHTNEVVGDGSGTADAVGQMLLNEMRRAGMRTDGLKTIQGERTAACSLVLEGHRDLVNGVADMGIVEKLDPELVSALVRWWKIRSRQVQEVVEGHKPDMIVFDCNPRVQVLERILRVGLTAGLPSKQHSWSEARELTPASVLRSHFDTQATALNHGAYPAHPFLAGGRSSADSHRSEPARTRPAIRLVYL